MGANGTTFTELFTILPLACAVFVFLFGLFVFTKDVKSRIHQLMFGFCMSMFMWMLGTFFLFGFRHANPQAAIFWDRFVYAGVVFMPSLMHHFSLIFSKKQGQKKLLVLNYMLSIFFLFISRTSLFVDDLYIYDWGAHTQARLFHHIFLAYFFVGTGIFFVNLLQYYRNFKDKQSRIQTLYVFLSFAIVIFIGGTAYLYGYGFDLKFPFAYFSGFVFPIMLFYAVSKHHLLGSKVVGTEVLVSSAVFILLIEVFLSKSLLELIARIIFALLVAAIGVLLIKSVKREVERSKELSQLAQSLEKANIRLKELDRQKTEFLSIASHQLRTPLSIIKGYLELIKDGAFGKVTKKTVKTLDEMDESNERLVKLVDEFLDITRIEQGRTKYHFDLTSMHELIDSVVKELTDRAAGKKLKIAWKAKKQDDMVFMDGEKVRHVVFNFVDNAIKYTPKGTITVLFEQDGKDAIVRVQDKGFGFNKEDEANFFQKFYRGKNVQGTNVNGTGLGIYVCKKFIEKHDGEVWGHSEGLGKGSEFGFKIPMKQNGRANKIEFDEATGDVVPRYPEKKTPEEPVQKKPLPKNKK